MSTPIQKIQSLSVGQLLLVETNEGQLLVGTLKSVNTKYLIIELENVRDISTNFTYQSPQLLAYTQMKKVKLFLNENDVKNHIENIESDSDGMRKSNVNDSSTCKLELSSSENSNNSKELCDTFSIQLTALDLKLLQRQLDNITFIKQTDQKYHKALNDMKCQSVIGLLVEPIQMGRNCKTSILAVSTPQNIYIFDMLALGNIFKEFRLILESERPRKTVHYSHKVADHLKYRHNVLLKGVFDTFLAYCIVTNEKTNLTLEKMVQKTFNISDVYFQAEVRTELIMNTYTRPLPHEQLIIIAKKVAFQLKLYDHLLHEYMLKSFYQQCDKFSQTFCSIDDNFLVGQELHQTSRAGFEHIQPNGNWKDKLNIDLKLLE